jgi:Ca-activated chloride channel family protein
LPFNSFVLAATEAFSTFAMDVDTASYTLTRQALRSGKLPDPERVRLEEIVNAFDYGDKASEKATFRIYQDGAQSAFGAGYNLLRIGVKGKRLGREEQRPAMLTMVLDVSGSMSQPDRIGFARLSLSSLLDQMGAEDRIQLIAYSDQAQLVLEPTPAKEKKRIMAAFDRLQCNGSTNLEEGLRRAYEQAVQAFVPGAENRVILISDGVANLGADSAQEILDKVSANRKQGITCSVFGVGAGTYNDQMLEGLANKGDGVYRFLDSAEAVKTAFVDDLAATLNTIAKDAKIQVEWNPKTVRQYRQMGYENRKLKKEQFRDDTVDAGEVGSGQSVTALYELDLIPNVTPESLLGTVRIRYQRVDTGKVEEISAPLLASAVLKPAHQATPSFKVAAAAAEFAELLRGSPNAQGGSFEAVADYLRPAALEMTLDTRVKELLELVTTANALSK